MARFEKVIGFEAIKEQLNMALDAMLDVEKYRKLGVTVPKGILLDGVPGIGKTLIAKEFIAESGRKSFVIRKNKADGEFVDLIRETFNEAARNAPSIILLDDMDKFANEDSYHRNADEYVTIQSCIDDVKDKDVFVIATTNEIQYLPSSLTRSGRFDWIFNLNVPNAEDSEKIFSYYLKNKHVERDVDTMELARFARGYSCASLEKVVNDAGLHAGFEGRELISQDDLIQSCLRTFYGMKSTDKTIPEAKLRRIAIHEAGHVVISELLYPGFVDFSSINCNKHSSAGGLTTYRPNEEENYKFEGLENRIMISLGGKASVEVVTGEIDTGANGDMHNVYDQVRCLLDDHTAYDFDSWCHGNETAETVYSNLDRATGLEVSRYYKKTKQLLIKNRELLDAVIEDLYAKKTISYKDLEQLSKLRKSA
ncbi:cell division protease FtsH [Oribacterium sp. KHPX15]|uniref:AAA family ATPase n=1 Tax=Oribacterium sp. KHPX15 TaxID=1855342 RepID=UPI0008956AA9|nr:AAA family ATPase [Oribacterium sp. KHPX15]SEA17112.1 cell division protease FtsH [Oribacterium sp. KHPX15]